MLIIGCGHHTSEQSVHHPFSELAVPVCRASRPAIEQGRSTLERHACWRAGGPNDRSVSATCRIDSIGEIHCLTDQLGATPPGSFEFVDDNGTDACAVREQRGVSCWSSLKLDWSQAPSDLHFRTVSVGKGVSPMGPHPAWPYARSYACGVADGNSLICWEQGKDGRVVKFPDSYVEAAAGGGRLCAITLAQRLRCWRGGTLINLALEPDPELPGPFKHVDVGPNSVCTIDGEGQGSCWTTTDGTESLFKLGAVTSVKAGADHVCSLHNNGEIECVGEARPAPRIRLRYLSRPSVFGNYCGITQDGISYCWGDPSSHPMP